MIEGVTRYKRWRNMVSTDVLIPLRNRYDKSNLRQCDKLNIINWEILTENFQYYFSNSTSLTLVPSTKSENRILRTQYIESLQKICSFI